MNNKGFTLVELLAVIVLLSIVAGIGTTSVIGARKKINQRLVNTKIGEIITAAKDLGQDNKSKFTSTGSITCGYNSINYDSSNNYFSITVQNLIDSGYLETDETCTSGATTVKCYKNNVTNESMNNGEIIIKKCSSGANRICACIKNFDKFGDTDTIYFDTSYSC